MDKVRFFQKIALAASFVFATAFMFSCSSEDGKDGASCTVKPKLSATDGFDVFCNDEKIGELSNGKDADCILSPKHPPKTDTMLVICNDAVAGEILNGKNCNVEDEGVYVAMKCEEEEKVKLPKAMCGTTAYDPAENECSNGILYLNFTDARDGKKYKGVSIGEQIWMTENLNYSGLPDTALGKCYAEGVDKVLPDSIARNCAKYGRLYNWATAMGIDSSYNHKGYTGAEKKKDICPAGWHVPSSDEWLILTNFIGNYASGIKLKATKGWREDSKRMQSSVLVDNVRHNFYYEIPISCDGTDDYGFSALPGGYAYSNGNFYGAGENSHWWSSSENDISYADYRYLSYYSNSNINNSYGNKTYLYSIRCIKDQ